MEIQIAKHLTNLTINNYSKINIKIKTAKDPLSSEGLILSLDAIFWGSEEIYRDK